MFFGGKGRTKPLKSALIQIGVWLGILKRNPKVCFNILHMLHVLLPVKLLLSCYLEVDCLIACG